MIACETDRLTELKIGQTESLVRTISAEEVAAFARLSGDCNALHMDDEFAARTEFGQRVVHGFLHASLLSTLVGMKLPGRGALYISQEIEFTKPVFIGEIKGDGQFDVVWKTPGLVAGDAWSKELDGSKDLIGDWVGKKCGNWNTKTNKCGGQGS